MNKYFSKEDIEVADRYMTSFLTSLFTGETQIKSTTE